MKAKLKLNIFMRYLCR